MAVTCAPTAGPALDPSRSSSSEKTGGNGRAMQSGKILRFCFKGKVAGSRCHPSRGTGSGVKVLAAALPLRACVARSASANFCL